MNRTQVLTLILSGAVAIGAGCNSETPPAHQAKEGIEKAEEGLAEAKTSIDTLRQDQDALEEKVASLRSEIASLGKKQLALLEAQAGLYESQLARLPAEKETALKPKIAEFKTLLKDVQMRIDDLKQASAAESEQAIEAFEESMKETRDAFSEIEKAMESAAAVGG